MKQKELDKMVRGLGWKDIQLIKASVFLITLPIGAYLYQHILPYWWAFVALGILTAVKPIKTALGK